MPVRIFISSKMSEFDGERAAMAALLGQSRTFEVTLAEDWGAQSAGVEEVYLARVRRCHIYVGLFGRLYSPHTEREYHEACGNPHRHKLIYLKKGARAVDPQLDNLLAVIAGRHKAFRYSKLGDLLSHFTVDLEHAVDEMLSQFVQMSSDPPRSLGGQTSVLRDAWRNKRRQLVELYGDGTTSEAELRDARANVPRVPRTLWDRLLMR